MARPKNLPEDSPVGGKGVIQRRRSQSENFEQTYAMVEDIRQLALEMDVQDASVVKQNNEEASQKKQDLENLEQGMHDLLSMNTHKGTPFVHHGHSNSAPSRHSFYYASPGMNSS